MGTPSTLQSSFSFYIGPSSPSRVAAAAALADAVTVAGKGGPTAVRKLRQQLGLTTPVLFDRCGYAPHSDPIELPRWIDEQRCAGADRVLTAGRLVTYSRTEPGAWRNEMQAELAVAEEFEATALVALDARILARLPDSLIAVVGESRAPVAFVLVDRGDPLSVAGATEALSRLVRNTRGISVIRSDHGAIAVPAFGGAHASVGLVGSNRHYSMGQARAKPTRMNRVFVPYYLDWFTADLIAGWAAADQSLACHLSCCDGQGLDRFFDQSLDPVAHNMTAIAAFADHVLNADPVDRPRTFLDLVALAHARYDINGIHGPASKPQLNSWALL